MPIEERRPHEHEVHVGEGADEGEEDAEADAEAGKHGGIAEVLRYGSQRRASGRCSPAALGVRVTV